MVGTCSDDYVCPWCSMYDKFRIITVILLFIVAMYFIYSIQDDISGECMTRLKKYSERLQEIDSGQTAGIKSDRCICDEFTTGKIRTIDDEIFENLNMT